MKCFYQQKEREGEEALRLREDYQQRKIKLCGPDVLVSQLANVLHYRPDLEESHTKEAIESIYEVKMLGPLTEETMREAIKIAFQDNASVYDGICLAFADEHRSWLITADRQFHLKVKQLPWTIVVVPKGATNY